MGAETYSRVLSHSVMSGLVREFEQDSASMVGKQIFKTKTVMSPTVGIDIITNPRHLAKYRHPDAPASKEALKAIKHIDVTLPTIKLTKMLPASILKALRQPGTEHQAYGRQALVEELEGMDIQIENTLEKSRWDLLQTGIVAQTASDIDEVGFSIDFGIDSDHTPTLLTTAKWSASTTCDPINDILGWMKTFAQNSGKRARYAIMTSTVMGYLINATATQSMMGDRLKDEIFVQGKIKAICGLDGLIQYDMGYVPSGGSFTNFLGADKFVLWSGDAHPEYVGIFNDVDATTAGKFSKSWTTPDPSGMNILLGICALPSGERIKEFFCADVA